MHRAEPACLTNLLKGVTMTADARLLQQSIARSHKLARLSDKSKILFFYLVPHFNSHGKMNGDAYYIKGACVPLLEDFTINLIEECLKEIHLHTNVKRYQHEGLWYLQSMNFEEHQSGLRRRGADKLPSYGGSTPDTLCIRIPALPHNSSTTPVPLPPDVDVDIDKDDDVDSKPPAPKKIKKPEKKKYREFVQMTEEEHDKLVARFGAKGTADWLDRVDLYIGSTGKTKTYKDHYRTVLSWAQRDNDNGIGQQAQKPSSQNTATYFCRKCGDEHRYHDETYKQCHIARAKEFKAIELQKEKERNG